MRLGHNFSVNKNTTVFRRSIFKTFFNDIIMLEVINVKTFCFTVDDNIRVFKEITESMPKSIFDHPYLSVYKRLHDEFGLKVQLNLFYKVEGFDLSEMTEKYRNEWAENSDWLKMSFHSEYENVKPYEFSGYDEVFEDCKRVQDEILRFAPSSLAKTTTVHFCLATMEGLRALSDNGVAGLLGLFGSNEAPRTSYGIANNNANDLRNGQIVAIDNISYGAIDIVLNCFSKDEIIEQLERLNGRSGIRVMIHEQYFYRDYCHYQPDFEDKLRATFDFLTKQGYCSSFFEELI